MFETLPSGDLPAPAQPAAAGTGVAEREFRDALGQFASGVTIISVRDENGAVHGMTATAFCSLSLRPPLVLVAVAHNSRCHRLLQRENTFGVSVLFEAQAPISRHFGGKPSADLSPVFVALGEAPVLAEAMVRLACRVQKPIEGGDHSIFIGLVTSLEMQGGSPLLHFAGRYRALAPEPAG
jgi:flavin reductase (DIM6/NTAB) family NADH-FMN oxidoreductase RutF